MNLEIFHLHPQHSLNHQELNKKIKKKHGAGALAKELTRKSSYKPELKTNNQMSYGFYPPRPGEEYNDI